MHSASRGLLVLLSVGPNFFEPDAAMTRSAAFPIIIGNPKMGFGIGNKLDSGRHWKFVADSRPIEGHFRSRSLSFVTSTYRDRPHSPAEGQACAGAVLLPPPSTADTCAVSLYSF